MLGWSEEGFEDVREKEGGGVLGGGGGDVAVEDGDWGWDCCCWALLILGVSIGSFLLFRLENGSVVISKAKWR